MDDRDPYICAKLLLDQHSDKAEFVAAQRADDLGAAGDEAGRRTWMRILAALDELQRRERRPGERLQ